MGERPGNPGAQHPDDRARFDYLTKASEVLESSLDYDTTLARLAALLVPGLGDWCSIDLMPDPDTLQNIAVAHVDPDRVALAQQVRDAYPPDPHADAGVARVVRTGEPEHYPEIPDEMLVQAAHDEQHLRLLRELGLRSAITAPLSARGRRFGAITLVSSESGRIFDQEDLQLIVALGERAGLAIDNARLYEAERQAVERLATISEASEILERTLDYERSFHELATLMVRRLADVCIIDVLEEHGGLRRVVALARDPAKQRLADVIRDRPPTGVDEGNPINRVILTGETQHGPYSDDAFQQIARDEEHFRALRDLGLAAYVSLPLVARARTLGVLTLASTRPYSDTSIELATELARRAAVALDNTRLFEVSKEIADTLQRSLLPPTLPDVPGLELASIFRAGAPEAEVGGDFYDVFELPGGDWAAVIGDVCGRGTEAATMTALARYGVRAGAIRGERPRTVLRMLNHEVLVSGGDRFCTLVYTTIHRERKGASITLARGGHPPPVVLRGDGELEILEPAGELIGVFAEPRFDDTTVRLRPGDTLFLYTDGATDRGGDRDEANWFAVLRSCARLGATQMTEKIEQHLIETGDIDDDVAVLVMKVPEDG